MSVLKVMVTHDDFRKVLAEMQVRSPEHLRLDTVLLHTERHAAAFTIYTKGKPFSVRVGLIVPKHLSLPHNIGRVHLLTRA